MPGKLHKPVRNGMFPISLKFTQFHRLYYIKEKIPIIIVKEIDFGVSLEIFILRFPEPKKVVFTKYPWLGLAPKPPNNIDQIRSKYDFILDQGLMASKILCITCNMFL